MALRHKAIKATLDVGTHDEWNDDHISDFEDELTYEYSPIGFPVNAMWDVGEVAGGSNPVAVLEDGHTIVYLNTGGVTDQTSSMRHFRATDAGDITSTGDAPILTCAVWLEAYHTVGNVAEWGLFPYATAIFTANQDGAYFRIEDNVLYAVTGDGAAETTTDVTPAGGIPEYGHYRIELSSSNCLFYVDDMDTVAATHTANLPNNDMTIKFSIRSKNNIDSKMYMDGVGLTRNRYTG